MKQDNKTKPFDNLLMAYITKESQDTFISSSSDKEAEIVFTKNFNVEVTKKKADALLSSLTQSLSKDTLGSLVQKALARNTKPVSELQSLTGLSPSLLEDIKTDMVFTNSVPVKSLAKLLIFLHISLDKAQAAINTTFDKLSAESKMFLSIPANAQPAFRKGVSHSDSAFDCKRVKLDESYLYQNKEALEKYIKRFTELYYELSGSHS
jgi:hypothetical protein